MVLRMAKSPSEYWRMDGPASTLLFNGDARTFIRKQDLRHSVAVVYVCSMGIRAIRRVTSSRSAWVAESSPSAYQTSLSTIFNHWVSLCLAPTSIVRVLRSTLRLTYPIGSLTSESTTFGRFFSRHGSGHSLCQQQAVGRRRVSWFHTTRSCLQHHFWCAYSRSSRVESYSG